MHTNRLAQEKSPYLLQHAHNPVDWRPWGPEAFDTARREDKPVFPPNREPGEMVATGLPILPLIDLTDSWATFFIREDQLAGLNIGTRVRLGIPALANREEEFQVSYLAAAADFATWRSTSAQGGIDVKTFAAVSYTHL